MDKGIANSFKNKYGMISELLAQNKKVGQLTYLKFNDQFIIYLITKSTFSRKPNYRSIFETLKYLKNFYDSHNIKKLSMPKIASGIDQLNWDIVFNMLKYIFEDTTINITVSTFTPSKQTISLVEPINIHLLQIRDEYLQQIIEAVKNPSLTEIKWLRKSKSYIINTENNLLYYRDI